MSCVMCQVSGLKCIIFFFYKVADLVFGGSFSMGSTLASFLIYAKNSKLVITMPHVLLCTFTYEHYIAVTNLYKT